MTCKEIYDLTMAMMDEMIDNTSLEQEPKADYPSTRDYQARTPGILTTLATEVTRYLKSSGVDIDYQDDFHVMADNVDFDEGICRDILVYGLAARLLGQEDASMSSLFNNLYLSGLAKAVDSMDDKPKGKQYSGNNIYGLLEAGD